MQRPIIRNKTAPELRTDEKKNSSEALKPPLLNTVANTKIKLDVITTGYDRDKEVELDHGEIIVIGRSERADVQIPEADISREHIMIFNHKGDIFVEDLDSTNGSLLNSIHLEGKMRLNSGDTIQVGNALIKINFKSNKTCGSESDTIPEIKQNKSDRLTAKLTIATNTAIDNTSFDDITTIGETITLDEKLHTLKIGRTERHFRLSGRSIRKSIERSSGVVELTFDNPSISRKHATIHLSNEGLVIIDEGSTNGTFVGGKKIDNNQMLRERSLIDIATFSIRISELSFPKDDF